MQKLLIVLIILVNLSCKSSQQQTKAPTIVNEPNVLYLDKSAAEKAIVKDDVENFFHHITTLDMSIQLKKNYPKDIDRSLVLEDYKAMLQEETMDFTKAEKAFVKEIMDDAWKWTNKVSKDIFPKEMKLIKVKGRHYGPGTWYTRENCIVIPEGALAAQAKESFYSTVLHEIFHIYSRYHKAEKESLYKLIGFTPINKGILFYTPHLTPRILANPDGLDLNYKINLTDQEGNSFDAIGLITSKSAKYDPSKFTFFDYIQFHLYKIQSSSTTSETFNVIAKEDLSPDFDLSKTNFGQQIKDNTGYIIHPDEIMADNFMYMIMTEENPGFIDQFSIEGQQLIKDIKRIIAQ